jgi:hypothetical protein
MKTVERRMVEGGKKDEKRWEDMRGYRKEG